VLQDVGFYIFYSWGFRQIPYRDVKLWEARSLISLQNGGRYFAIPRRFCAGQLEWQELVAWFGKRFVATRVEEPKTYDGGEPSGRDTSLVACCLPQITESPIVAVSQGPLLPQDLRRKSTISAKLLRLAVLGLFPLVSGLIALATSGHWAAVFTGSALGYPSVLGLYLWNRKRTDTRDLKDWAITSIVRESCLEQAGSFGRLVCRWDALRCAERGENTIKLLIGPEKSVVVLSKRVFSELDWRRIQERVALLVAPTTTT
jgi:hypothetical protein